MTAWRGMQYCGVKLRKLITRFVSANGVSGAV